MSNWSNKRYWLIGASEGLGHALAKTMSEHGVELIVSARSEGPLKALCDSLPGKACYYTCLLYTSPSPRDATLSRMPSSA